MLLLKRWILDIILHWPIFYWTVSWRNFVFLPKSRVLYFLVFTFVIWNVLILLWHDLTTLNDILWFKELQQIYSTYHLFISSLPIFVVFMFGAVCWHKIFMMYSVILISWVLILILNSNVKLNILNVHSSPLLNFYNDYLVS